MLGEPSMMNTLGCRSEVTREKCAFGGAEHPELFERHTEIAPTTTVIRIFGDDPLEQDARVEKTFGLDEREREIQTRCDGSWERRLNSFVRIDRAFIVASLKERARHRALCPELDVVVDEMNPALVFG